MKGRYTLKKAYFKADNPFDLKIGRHLIFSP